MILLKEDLTPIAEKIIHALPDAKAEIDPDAARINGFTPEAWIEKGAVTQEEMFKQIQYFLRGQWSMKLIAHNLPFDKNFVEALFTRFIQVPRGDKKFTDLFSYWGIDTLSIAAFTDIVHHDKCRTSYQLGRLAESYNVEHTDAHSALSDIQTTIGVMRAMRDSMRQMVGIDGTKFVHKLPDNHILTCIDRETPVWLFTGGKYNGEFATAVREKDPSYIHFLLRMPDLSEAQRTYLQALCK